MKKIFSTLILFVIAYTAKSQYRVTLQTPNYKSGLAYLTYYYGKNRNVQDSALLNNKGIAVFKKNEKLLPGIYSIIFPGKINFVDFFVDKEQIIIIKADTNDLLNKTIVTGSKENALFQQYQKFIAIKGKQLQAEQEGYNSSKTKAESTRNVITIPLKKENGIYMIPCKVNGLSLSFVFDTGASDVSISSAELIFMLKNNYMSEKDIIGENSYSDANGSIRQGSTILLKSIEIGGIVLTNIRAIVVHNLIAPLLLGQTALQKFGKFTFDNQNNNVTINRSSTSSSTPSQNLEMDEHEKKYTALNNELNQYRENIIKQYPQSMLATLFKTMRQPGFAVAHPVTKQDSVTNYEFYKKHYWDGITFMDNTIIRTPFFLPKVEKYFRDILVPSADTIIKEADYLLLLARTNIEMYKFLLNWLTDEYIYPKYMGQDAVFVHLFEKYHSKGISNWLNEKQLTAISNRAYMVMSNLIGEKAADLDMVDSTGKPYSLYNVEAKYTVVCFWDPTCSHCREEIPRLDSLYRAKWKQQGVKIYGVLSENEKVKWLQFIKENKLQDWIHVYQTEETKKSIAESQRPGYKQLYDITQTPILYLLDKEKQIIAKKLTLRQMDELLQTKLNYQHTN